MIAFLIYQYWLAGRFSLSYFLSIELQILLSTARPGQGFIPMSYGSARFSVLSIAEHLLVAHCCRLFFYILVGV